MKKGWATELDDAVCPCNVMVTRVFFSGQICGSGSGSCGAIHRGCAQSLTAWFAKHTFICMPVSQPSYTKARSHPSAPLGVGVAPARLGLTSPSTTIFLYT